MRHIPKGPVESWTPEEAQEFLAWYREQQARRRKYRPRRSDLEERDPKAYYTKRADWERAEKAGKDTSFVPDLNHQG
jgi:hypothetical protein